MNERTRVGFTRPNAISTMEAPTMAITIRSIMTTLMLSLSGLTLTLSRDPMSLAVTNEVRAVGSSVLFVSVRLTTPTAARC